MIYIKSTMLQIVMHLTHKKALKNATALVWLYNKHTHYVLDETKNLKTTKTNEKSCMDSNYILKINKKQRITGFSLKEINNDCDQ